MTRNTCNLIQWSKLETRNGKPVCPECGEPAENILGMLGEQCWAHAPKTKGATDDQNQNNPRD